MSRIAIVGLLATALLGCHDPDRFLSGKWFSDELMQPENVDDARRLAKILGCQSDDCEMYVEMNLGHYGEDVVGVLRFFRDGNRVSPTTCAVEGCTCRSIRGVFRSDGVFRFTFYDCAGCLQTAEVVRDTDERIIWKMTPTARTDPPEPGCIPYDGSQLIEDVELVLNKLNGESQLTVSDKACEECGL